MSPRLPILRFCVVLILFLAVLGSGLWQVQSAAPLTFTVTSFVDLNDSSPGNSVCNTENEVDGYCTLRAAITEANQNVPYMDIVIKLPAGEYNLTISPVYSSISYSDNHSGDLNIGPFMSQISHSITIEPLGGGPVVIKNTVEDRILTVGRNVTVTMKNLTLQGGRVLIDDKNNLEGGGAIHNSGSLNLNGVDLANNSVACRSDCTSSEEDSNVGGAIYSSGTVELLNSTLDGNSAGRGSAIFNTGDSSIPNFKVVSSTISNNHTLAQSVITNYANLSIINSTFSGNDSLNPSTFVTGIMNVKTLQMQSSTMANKGPVGGIFNLDSGSVYLQDNIFKAETEQVNCIIQEDSTWTSWGYNIASDDSCNLTAVGDLPSTDPQLGSFGSWGGPTKTYMLKLGSPAINHKASPCIIKNPLINYELVNDQRYWPRSDGKCDTGAYEFSPWYLYLPVITR